MALVETTVTALVWLSVLWLFALALLCVWAPALATDVLSAFARTRRGHFIEQGLRIVAGGAFWLHAQHTVFVTMFRALGAVLIVSSMVLMLLPWRWHRRFAEQVVPPIVRHLNVYAVAALSLGLCISYALVVSR